MKNLNSTILIIGASSGIGYALAEHYAKLNYKVFAVARRTDLLDTLTKKYPNKISTQSFDVTKDNASLLIKNVSEILGTIGYIIYNSGYGKAVKEFNADIELQTTETNVNGFINCMNASITYFKTIGTGHFASVSSIVAHIANANAPSYSASKSYMSMYSYGIRKLIKKTHPNIYISDIRPGYVDTAMGQTGKIFWRISAEKSASYIEKGIANKSSVIYVSRRWRLIAWLFKLINLHY